MSKKMNAQHKVEAEKVIKELAQISVEKQNQTTLKKPDEPYQDILTFPETDKVSFFKNKNYNTTVSIGLNTSYTRSIVRVQGTGASLRIIRANFLDQRWLDIIRPRDMPKKPK